MAEDAKAVVAARAQKMLPKNFGMIEFRHNTWAGTLEEGTDFDNIFRPEFWAHVSRGVERSIKAGDTVQIRTFDHTLYAEFYVRDAGPGFAKVALLFKANLESRAAADIVVPSNVGLKERWNVGSKRWDVIRTGDKKVMTSGLALKEDALKWIVDHVKAIGSAA